MKREMIVSFVIGALAFLSLAPTATAQNLDLSLWNLVAQDKETAGVANDGAEIQVVTYIDNLTAGSSRGGFEVICHLDRVLDPGAISARPMVGPGPLTIMPTPTPAPSTGGPVMIQPHVVGVKPITATGVRPVGTVTPEVQPVSVHPSSYQHTARVLYSRVATYTQSLTGPIDPYDNWRSWAIFPAGMSPGKYRVVCEADSNNSYTEPDESNNRAEIEFRVWRARDVDYTHTLTYIDETLGQTVTPTGVATAGFAIKIRNDGSQPTSNANVTCTVNDLPFKRRKYETAMNEPGGESTHWFYATGWQQSWEFPAGNLPVECEIEAVGANRVDVDQKLVETTFSESIVRGTPVVESADLYISAITFSAHPDFVQNVHAGRNLWAMPKIRHNDQTIVSGPIVVQCNLSVDNTIIATAAAEVSDIKPSGTTADVGFGPQPGDTYEVRCTADVTSQVNDPNRQNNSRTASVTIPS